MDLNSEAILRLSGEIEAAESALQDLRSRLTEAQEAEDRASWIASMQEAVRDAYITLTRPEVPAGILLLEVENPDGGEFEKTIDLLELARDLVECPISQMVERYRVTAIQRRREWAAIFAEAARIALDGAENPRA